MPRVLNLCLARLIRVIGILLAFTLSHTEETFSHPPHFDAKLQLAIGHLEEFSNGDTFPTKRSKEAPEVRATPF